MSKDWRENITDDYRQESRKWFDEAFKNVDPDKFMAGARRTITKSKAFLDSQKDMVWDQGKLVPINPEYLARAEATKKLKEQLKTYTGSTEFASDLLYLMKKEADAEGRDFSKAALNKIEEMKGNLVDNFEEIDQIIKEAETPKKPLASRILHKLWKWGFPVGIFIRKELSVEEADKA